MNRVLTWIILASTAFLVWFSAYLAAMRIYQVDECQNVYMASILAARQEKVFFTDASGFTTPLSWLARGVARSNDLFTSARFVMLEVFWLNLVLIALATGERLCSRRGLIALFAAATLAPLWDYGFEIRHDNLLLTGLLLIWCVVRVRPSGLQSYFIAGAVVVGLQFIAFKAFAYTVPLSLAILAFPPPGHRAPRWKLALAWGTGVAGAFLAIRLLYAKMGLWEVYLVDFHGISEVSTRANRFAPWGTLIRLLNQTPLLLAVSTAALVATGMDLRRCGKAALTWNSGLPEALLFLGATGVLLINPTPFPYNLLQLVPFAFLFAFRHVATLAQDLRDRAVVVPLVATTLIFAHLVPFGLATLRHLDRTNGRQDRLMSLAETLTDPAKDAVYDAIGMVPTRPSIDFHWFLHSLNIQNFIKGPGPRLRDMLEERPAAVLIPSYRTGWLPREDHEFIRQRYVAVADDFWVLGTVLPAGGGTFEIVHPGRYRISSVQGSDLLGTYPEGWEGVQTPEDKGTMAATLDGAPFAAGVVELTAGKHAVETVAGCQPAVVWMGPKLERIHRLGRGDHRQLFSIGTEPVSRLRNRHG